MDGEGKAGRRSEEAAVRKESERAAARRESGWSVKGWSAENRVDGAQMVVHSPNGEHKKRSGSRATGCSGPENSGRISRTSAEYN